MKKKAAGLKIVPQLFYCALFYPGDIRTGDPKLLGNLPLCKFISVVETVAHFQNKPFPGRENGFYPGIEEPDIVAKGDLFMGVVCV